jgi:hypothetical protein
VSPVTQGSQDPDSERWQWLRIEDFTPGCYDASNVATDTPLIEAPLGAGNATSTFCCMALRAGGLGPLPKMVQSYTWEVTFPGSPTVTGLFIVGAAVVPSIGPTSQPVVIVEGDNGVTHFWIAYALDLTTNILSIIHTIAATTQPGIFGSPYPFFTRAYNGTTPTLHAGTPILVFPASIEHDTAGTAGHVFVYPTPTNRGTYAVKDLVTPGTQITGQTIGYANRILVLSGIGYTWPGGSFGVNENIAFTTPPNSYHLGNQQTVLAAETPFGFGAWGSVSTGELVIIKKQGGGVVVNGDIEAPSSVLYLPGIQPIGNFVGKAAAAQQGLYYCSEDRGAWLWNGGNTSQKISQQLRDGFYDVTSTVIASNNFGFFCARWGAWMLFSGNWIFNPTQGGWWPLYPQKTKGSSHVTGVNLFWFNQGTFGHQMWASPIEITPAAHTWLYRFDNRVDAPHWQWTSLPIHVAPTANHVVDVRQVVVRASCGSAGSTVTVKIGTWSATSTSGAIGTAPTPIRFNVGLAALGLNDIVIEVTGDQTTATAASPIVHSIDVAYQLRAHVAADN